MAEWHLNGSLVACRGQLKQRYRGLVVYSIGDEDHQQRKSDHNPNKYHRVNANDYMLDKGSAFHHADALWVCKRLVTDARTKYVIYDRQIWEAGEWRPYGGTNPHTDHVHHSVFDSAHTKREAWPLETKAWPHAKLDNYAIPLLQIGMDDRDYEGYNCIERVQRMVGAKVDGIYGRKTAVALQAWFPGDDCVTLTREMYCALMGIYWIGP